MPARKGLLAPQNTFLDTIATRFDGTLPGEISIVYEVVMEAITCVIGVVAMEVVVVVKIIVAEKVEGSNSRPDNNFTL
ncbi:hypothetical protein M8J76_000553 [Diaphorina citri]|nr:hypothetical protein M8J76_000553 [Diaphorina citri]